MSIPVQIEHGNHVIQAQLHALPHVGDRITCVFPSLSGSRVFLIVTRVAHHQFGNAPQDPYAVTVVTDEDPEQKDLNRKAMEQALKDQG